MLHEISEAASIHKLSAAMVMALRFAEMIGRMGTLASAMERVFIAMAQVM